MATIGYLSVAGVEDALGYLANRFPDFCTRIALPENTYEGRSCSTLRIGKSAGIPNGVLLLGGVHAREIVCPELLVRFAYRLCFAYAKGSGLQYGRKFYSAAEVKLLVESLHIYVFPQVNPDGRAFVLSPGGDSWWRKNRRPVGSGCVGVDLNRNFDFLWSSGIGTSANPCDYQLYRGDAAFSEAETRNVRYLLDTYPIDMLLDVHSYSELILYPWGDDDNQTGTAAMNFRNPDYDGVRGAIGDSAYREYIPVADLNRCVEITGRMKGAIAAVRGRSYTPEPGAGLYPTSGTSNDYAYARHFGTGAHKVLGFCIETGTEFQPPLEEGLRVIDEVSAGLFEFCLASVCAVESVASGTPVAVRLADLRRFREKVLLGSKVGREYASMLEDNNRELLGLAVSSRALRQQARNVLQAVSKVVLTFEDPKPARFDTATLTQARAAIRGIVGKAGPQLRAALERIERELPRFAGKTVIEALRPPARARATARKRKEGRPHRR